MAKKRRKGPGRPEIAPEDRKTVRLTIRVTAAEYQRLLAEAKARNQPLADFIRERIKA